MSAVDYLKDPAIRAAVIKRRVVRCRKYLRKRHAPAIPSDQFLIAHGLALDGCITPEELEAQWALDLMLNPEPPPHPNPVSTEELQRIWAEATAGLSCEKAA